MDVSLHDFLNHQVVSFLLFGLLFSGLGLPFDKLFMVSLVGYILATSFLKIKINYINLAILSYWTLIAILSSAFNFTFKPMIFFPIIGIMLIFILTRVNWLDSFFKVLFIYIFISFCFGIAAYFGGPKIAVTSLATKGIPFLLPFKGFTTTVQTFGTLCMLWIILNFEMSEKKYGWKFFLVILTLILTLNRSSYLFLLVVLTIYNRKFLWFCMIMFTAALVLFYEEITGFVLNMSTLESRSELLQGFYISYWNQNSFLGYLFGKGNNFYDPEVIRLVKWQNRPDIENGYAMLLHTYGFLGLFGYILSALMLLIYIFTKKCYKLFMILLFYFFVTQFFTQEFVTTIFYLFIASILTLINQKHENYSH